MFCFFPCYALPRFFLCPTTNVNGGMMAPIEEAFYTYQSRNLRLLLGCRVQVDKEMAERFEGQLSHLFFQPS